MLTIYQFRAVATRYDKRERIYQGTIDVASISIWLPDPVLMIRRTRPSPNFPQDCETGLFDQVVTPSISEITWLRSHEPKPFYLVSAYASSRRGELRASAPRPGASGGFIPAGACRSRRPGPPRWSGRSWVKAYARRRMSASVTLMSCWTETMPAALCTAKWKSAPPLQILAGHRAGGALRAWASSTQQGGHAGLKSSASACCPPLSGPGPVAVKIQRSQAHRADPQREREDRPHAGPQHRRGEGGTYRAGHRLGQVGLGCPTSLLLGRHRRTEAFSPSVYCRSSICWLTSSVVPRVPRGMSPDISMIPAPFTPRIRGHAAHSRATGQAPSAADSSAKIR